MGGGGGDHPRDRPNTSGEGRVGQINTSEGRGAEILFNVVGWGGGGGVQVYNTETSI